MAIKKRLYMDCKKRNKGFFHKRIRKELIRYYLINNKTYAVYGNQWATFSIYENCRGYDNEIEYQFIVKRKPQKRKGVFGYHTFLRIKIKGDDHVKE